MDKPVTEYGSLGSQVQSSAFTMAMDRTDLQEMHADPSMAEYCPSGQGRHAVMFEFACLPAKHVVHDVAPGCDTVPFALKITVLEHCRGPSVHNTMANTPMTIGCDYRNRLG